MYEVSTTQPLFEVDVGARIAGGAVMIQKAFAPCGTRGQLPQKAFPRGDRRFDHFEA
jgi:hypothetical protein